MRKIEKIIARSLQVGQTLLHILATCCILVVIAWVYLRVYQSTPTIIFLGRLAYIRFVQYSTNVTRRLIRAIWHVGCTRLIYTYEYIIVMPKFFAKHSDHPLCKL